MTDSYQTLAFALSSEQRRALQIVRGGSQQEKATIEAEPLIILRELGLIRVEPQEERDYLEMTQKGRKVAEFV